MLLYMNVFFSVLVKYFINLYVFNDNDIILYTFLGCDTTLLKAIIMNKEKIFIRFKSIYTYF